MATSKKQKESKKDEELMLLLQQILEILQRLENRFIPNVFQ